MTNSAGERIAIVDWTHLVEDYLDNIGVSFDRFLTEMKGGWLFGYLAALKSAGYEPVFFCVSARADTHGWHYHIPSGCEVCVLPSPGLYGKLRKIILNPYAEEVEQAVTRTGPLTRPLYRVLLSAAEYLSTPLIALDRELAARQITKIISQEYESGRFDVLSLFGKLTGRSVFATFQGGIASPSRLKRLIRKITIRQSAGLICGSGEELARVRRTYALSPQKLGRIFNPLGPVPVERFDRDKARRRYGIAKDTRVAVWHGRIDLRRKGLDLIVRAWCRLTGAGLPFECRLLFFGYGNEAAEFRRLLEAVDHPGIEWIAEFSNDRSEILEFLSIGDVYVFASRHEGFPLAPIEAMSVGLPLLATDVSGIADILEHGRESGGIIVDLEDTTALAANLQRLFQDPELCRTLGQNARRRAVEAFSTERVGEQLKEFIERNAD